MFRNRWILTIDGGGDGGGGTATAAPPASAPTGPAAPPAPSASFDWKANGFDDAALNVIQAKGWKSPVEQHQSYVNLEKLVGAGPDKLIKIPTGSDPNAWNEVYSKLGRPADPNGYKIPVPEGDKGDFAKMASKWFHESGLSQNQAEKLASQWNAHQAETTKAEQTATAQKHSVEVEQLKASWGDKYQANTVLVDRAAQTFGLTDEHLQGLKAAMGPKAAMELLHQIGSKIGVDDQFVSGDSKPGLMSMSTEQAIAKIQSNKADRAFVERFNSQDPKTRSEAREEMDRLHQIAYPS
jgi:hypothetical protein